MTRGAKFVLTWFSSDELPAVPIASVAQERAARRAGYRAQSSPPRRRKWWELFFFPFADCSWKMLCVSLVMVLSAAAGAVASTVDGDWFYLPVNVVVIVYGCVWGWRLGIAIAVKRRQ